MLNTISFTYINPGIGELGYSALLLSYTAAIAFQRHLFRQSRSYRTRLGVKIMDAHQDMGTEDDTASEDTKTRQSLLMADRIIIRLYSALAATFILDIGMAGYHAYLFHTVPETAWIAAKVIALIAFTCNGIHLRNSTLGSGGVGPSWIDYAFGWVALLGTSVLARPAFAQGWNLIVSGAVFEKRANFDPWTILLSSQDVTKKVETGLFVVRYCLLWMVSVVSVMHLRGAFDITDFRIPATLLEGHGSPSGKNHVGATITSSQEKRHKEMEEIKQAEADAYKGIWAKIKLAIQLSYPWSEPKLRLYVFLKFLSVVIDRAINLWVPLQTERLLRRFTEDGSHDATRVSTFDPWPVVLYLFLSYMQQQAGVVQLLERIMSDPASSDGDKGVKLWLFEHLHHLSMQFHIDNKATHLSHRMINWVKASMRISQAVLFQIAPVIADTTIAIIYFWVAWGWKYGVLVSFNSVFYMVTDYYVNTRSRHELPKCYEVEYETEHNAMASLEQYETVKYFNAEAFEVGRYRDGLAKAIEMRNGQSYSERIGFSSIHTVLKTFIMWMGCMLCAYDISQGRLTGASFMSFILYFRQVEGPVTSLSWTVIQLTSAFSSMERLLKIMELEPTVKDIPNAAPLMVKGGEVVFENVSFQYDGNKKGLSNISFTVPKGKTVGIVGATGSGKTTILRLVSRFWDPTSGRILIDGQDIAKVTQLSLRQQIGVVPQEPVLFDDSIMYNIHYGRVNASKEDIIRATKAAHIHDSIIKFKDGYDTLVGDRGAKLSGGEKQRISLARTILKDSSILLLDEATSALDSTTECQIQATLSKMTQDRTTFVVAHRLSTIMHADLILVVKDGEIVERGTHAELLQLAVDNGGEGEYAAMWKIQQGRTTLSESGVSNDDKAVSEEMLNDASINAPDAVETTGS
ncbi:ATP-binding cassette sub- B member 6, mitochondrial [Mortierella claussenii]|nr:ATP-binding cassette sub- B member 6, mitochondrial [Mortierella claussenii]